MSMTDPIADMLTRIRNAIQAGHRRVEIPASNQKRAMAELLVKQGYIDKFEEVSGNAQGSLRLFYRGRRTGDDQDHDLNSVLTLAIGDPETEGDERVDLQALQDIAAATGGRAFQGEDREGLEAIYRELDALEPVEVETLSYRPRRPLYFWPLGLAVLLVFGYHLLVGLRAGARALRTRHRHA